MARVFTPTPVHNDTNVGNYGPSPLSIAVALIGSMMRERCRSRFLSMLPVNDDSQPSAEHESRPVRSDYRSGAPPEEAHACPPKHAHAVDSGSVDAV